MPRLFKWMKKICEPLLWKWGCRILDWLQELQRKWERLATLGLGFCCFWPLEWIFQDLIFSICLAEEMRFIDTNSSKRLFSRLIFFPAPPKWETIVPPGFIKREAVVKSLASSFTPFNSRISISAVDWSFMDHRLITNLQSNLPFGFYWLYNLKSKIISARLDFNIHLT